MAAITLLDFLQRDPRPFQHYMRHQSDSSTSNDIYVVASVETIHPWHEFNLGHIMQQFGPLLNNTRIAPDAHPRTPPPQFAAEDYLREIIAIYADRPVRRALARTFEHIDANPGLVDGGGWTEVTLGAGSSAKLVGKFVPDRAMFDPHVEVSVNRLPGEIKPSWKWKSHWSAPGSIERFGFLRRLSQLTFYMLQQGHRQVHQSGARYGYMLTDNELVAFRKLDARGTICMSQAIPWRPPSGDGTPRLTVLLALWYLGMLASRDDWCLPAQPGDPTDNQLISKQSQAQSQAQDPAQRNASAAARLVQRR